MSELPPNPISTEVAGAIYAGDQVVVELKAFLIGQSERLDDLVQLGGLRAPVKAGAVPYEKDSVVVALPYAIEVGEPQPRRFTFMLEAEPDEPHDWLDTLRTATQFVVEIINDEDEPTERRGELSLPAPPLNVLGGAVSAAYAWLRDRQS
jgi:hypothetical protein